MAQVEFRDVSFWYPMSDGAALQHVTIQIEQAEFVVLCGPSGCGKTTLLRHLKPSIAPYGKREGQVLYRDRSLAQLDRRAAAQQIGYVRQSPDEQIVTDKVWHELAFGLESLGYDQQTIRRRVAEMASFFGIQTWFRRSVSELSGGQKQLLNLASVMAMQPQVLVLDEPTSQLDPIAAGEFLQALRKINLELGVTIILSEHRLEEVFPLADRVIAMEDGHITCSGPAREVGDFLSRGQGRDRMFEGLPAVMKIYAQIGTGGMCPLTVREGRLWLQSLLPPRAAVTALPQPAESRTHPKPVLAEAKDVWFRYSRGGVDVVRGLDAQVYGGELYCLIGGNGVGKTTALKLLGGIYRPYRGKVLHRGTAMANNKNSLRVGLLPQDPQALFTEITVEEELFDALGDSRCPDREKERRIEQMLAQLELQALRRANPYDLSGGEQQRLALGKILLLQPELVLLDEPTKGLDPFFKAVLADILKGLAEQGIGVVMVTHDIEFAAEHADRCAMLFDGQIVSQGRPRAFFSGNSFYTTAADRMSRGVFEGAVTYRDVVELCRQNGI
ncbi:ABC transporter ATP-binding protein [Neobittarella massiliensis]|uniref:ABC transporter ATP-binding protein n=1 Tax=Neobittarella massiliensis (ex Bilen et al. 2018) TaxID=2041842 RepID=UPI000CF6BC18|nr:ABC transporter ATP-binding protein [Neobittarella massiliensis]